MRYALAALLLSGCAYYPKTNEIRYGLDLPRDAVACYAKVKGSRSRLRDHGLRLGVQCAF